MKLTKQDKTLMSIIKTSFKTSELQTDKETTKKAKGKRKSLVYGSKSVKTESKPINARGKDNLNKFLGQHTKRMHVENRSRFYQLRIQLKEKDVSTKIKKEIIPALETCNKTIVLSIEKLNSLLSNRYNKTNIDCIYSLIKTIRVNRKRIEELTTKKNNLLFLYKFRYGTFKELFLLFFGDLNNSESSNQKAGFGIDLNRNYIYSLLPLPFEQVKSYTAQLKTFLLSIPFQVIRHKKLIERTDIKTGKLESLTLEQQKERREEEITLLDLFRIGIYRETKNKDHHLRQVSATNLLKYESYPTLSELSNSAEMKVFITDFKSKFNELVKLESVELKDLQNELSIHTCIVSVSKLFTLKFNDIEHIQDLTQDAYIHFTLDKPLFSVNNEDLFKSVISYFNDCFELYQKNKAKTGNIEVIDEDDKAILNIPYHLNSNTAYQMEQCLDFDMFSNWIETRKYIQSRTKEVILFVLANLTMKKSELEKELNISKYYLRNCIEKLTVYSKRYNDLGIYEFLMHKYYNKPMKLGNKEDILISYESPKILKGKAIDLLKKKEIVNLPTEKRYRPLNTGRTKEMVKQYNFAFSEGGL